MRAATSTTPAISLATTVASYRGAKRFPHARRSAALAVDVKWPFVGSVPRRHAAPDAALPDRRLAARSAICSVPNEDARAVDLEDSNLFALNRFPGYDRLEDSTRVHLRRSNGRSICPGFTINADDRPELSPRPAADDLSRRHRPVRPLVRHRRADRSALPATSSRSPTATGSTRTISRSAATRSTRRSASRAPMSCSAICGSTATSTRRSRICGTARKLRVGGARRSSPASGRSFGSTSIDLTNQSEDPLSLADGFDPVRHRLGVQYEDDCLRLGLTWRRDYQDTGDARARQQLPVDAGVQESWAAKPRFSDIGHAHARDVGVRSAR